MKALVAIGLLSAFLTGCGVETASSAATAAATKAKEVEEGKRTLAKVRDDLDAATKRARNQ